MEDVEKRKKERGRSDHSLYPARGGRFREEGGGIFSINAGSWLEKPIRFISS